jgi:hypothetical protein
MTMLDKSIIQLVCGRQIQLIALNQSFTYEGLIEGLPTEGMNRNIIDRIIMHDAVKWGYMKWDSPPYLIEPVQTPVEIGRKYPFGKPASIPGYKCLARFASRTPARNVEMDFSEMTIVWFQNSFAFPIEESILEKIRSLDWTKHATDYSI